MDSADPIRITVSILEPTGRQSDLLRGVGQISYRSPPAPKKIMPPSARHPPHKERGVNALHSEGGCGYSHLTDWNCLSGIWLVAGVGLLSILSRNLLITDLPVTPFHPIHEKPLLDRARQLGYEAFLDCRHYCENPFRERDWQRHDSWDEGWAAADRDHPGRFDHGDELFHSWDSSSKTPHRS